MHAALRGPDYIKDKGIRAVAVAKSAEQSIDRPDAKPALIGTAHSDSNIPQSAKKSSGNSENALKKMRGGYFPGCGKRGANQIPTVARKGGSG